MLKRVLPMLLILVLLFTSIGFAGGKGVAEPKKAGEPKGVSQEMRPEEVERALIQQRMQMRSLDCDECMNYNYRYTYRYCWCQEPCSTDGCVDYNYHHYYQWCEEPCCTDGCCYYQHMHAWRWAEVPDEPLEPVE